MKVAKPKLPKVTLRNWRVEDARFSQRKLLMLKMKVKIRDPQNRTVQMFDFCRDPSASSSRANGEPRYLPLTRDD